jgi:SnoaL-like domain
MNQQEMSDLLEIQQLAARYMSFSAQKEKDKDRWREIFTPDGVYNAFGTPYGLDDFPLLLESAPPGQYIGNVPIVDFDGDTATGVQHYVFIDQITHEMRLAWYTDEYVRSPEGWRIRSRSTTFMRRKGGFDSGNPHDPARFVAGQPIGEG